MSVTTRIAILLAITLLLAGWHWGIPISGPPPVGCTNQLVLDYSNSCALIGKPWGQ